MILHVIRAIFVLAVLAIAIGYATTSDVLQPPEPDATGEIPGLNPVTKVTLIIIIPALLAAAMIMADTLIQNKSLSSISGLFFGVVAGVFLAWLLGKLVLLGAGVFQPGLGAEELAKRPLIQVIRLLVGACAIFLCVSFIMQTKDDFRFVIPYLEFSKQTKGPHAMLLDTSVIIDGRIADICDTRIIESPLVVPRFVLEELQNIADSGDKLKRNRGRRGLDMLNRLRSNEKIDVRLVDARVGPVEEASEVDHKLVAFAQHIDARIVTNDYNLNKVAQLRGVEVININDLANALKPVVLPGETLAVKIIKPGEEVGQGIGYLDDGTMVVVEHGRDYIGQEMPLVVTSTLQTSAGRMIFGRPESDRTHPGPTRPRKT